ncbi:vesicle-associated membrane protein 3 [Numida meleagris]|uniref:vesicle-associated membrane protein 3 n=1 Tax=Numida meleagris TaxID=8996 RepID=UPI000B3DF76D|nr:vesicle-associated membrane protein 3 [Numida meleagris]
MPAAPSAAAPAVSPLAEAFVVACRPLSYNKKENCSGSSVPAAYCTGQIHKLHEPIFSNATVVRGGEAILAGKSAVNRRTICSVTDYISAVRSKSFQTRPTPSPQPAPNGRAARTAPALWAWLTGHRPLTSHPGAVGQLALPVGSLQNALVAQRLCPRGRMSASVPANSNVAAGSNRRLQQTQHQVDEVVDIMRVNVDKVLERDQKLSELDDRADALQAGASQFETSAAKLKRKYWWKNCKMWAILIAVVVIIIIIIIVVSVHQ